ncbi:MAG: glutamate racemase [Flavobacteriales bacterium]|nr:MAG: glutamate racemase [Flavobacteriales bacterium]
MNLSSNSIGIFDSGLGGLSVFKEIAALLPFEHSIYLADSKNAPYGNKSKNEIIRLSIKNTELLLQKGCKIIVVACNTATTNAIDYLRKNYNVPFIGIEPAIKPAALTTKSNTIGILATKGTLSSNLFHKTGSQFASHLKVIEQVGKGLVQLVETGKLANTETKNLLKTYLKPMLENNVDNLVLGCTHYPFLIPVIKDIVGDKITIIDSGQAVARQTKNVLEKHQILNNEKSEKSNVQRFFYTNANVAMLEKFVDKIVKSYTCSYLDF